MEKLDIRALAGHAQDKRIEESVRGREDYARAVLMNHVTHRFFDAHGFWHIGFVEGAYIGYGLQRLLALHVRLVITQIILWAVIDEADRKPVLSGQRTSSHRGKEFA